MTRKERCIIKSIQSGCSTNFIISKFANRKTDNIDKILKTIRAYKWKEYREREESSYDKGIRIDISNGGICCNVSLRYDLD